MWTRSELKQRAKQNLKRYHWAAVGACMILLILQMLAGSGNSNNSASSGDSYKDKSSSLTETYTAYDVVEYVEDYAMTESPLGMFSSILTTEIMFLGIMLTIVRVILNFVIVNPVVVGHSSFFYKNRYQKTSVGELAFAFNREDLFPVAKTMFFRDLYITLWSFLLVIPGIIKGYAYRMVPFILSEYPQMATKEALRLSEEMTRGHKLNIFVLDLSFFGWLLLGVFTLGISDIFFTTPYMYATEAELYHALKQPFTKQSAEADVF